MPHCPHCNSKRSAAIGAANYYEGTLVEHRCSSCGHLFCISDRRITPQRNIDFLRSPQVLHAAAQPSSHRKFN